MKKVEAFVRHEAFEPIRMELLTLGFPSLSIMEVKGSGRQKGITERYRGAELTNYLRPKVKIECVVASGDVQTVVDTILKHARTGSIGDGKVFVLPVDEAYRIRTGESGEETLQAHPGAARPSRSRRSRMAAAQPIEPAPARDARRAPARRPPGDGGRGAGRRRPRPRRAARRRGRRRDGRDRRAAARGGGDVRGRPGRPRPAPALRRRPLQGPAGARAARHPRRGADRVRATR